MELPLRSKGDELLAPGAMLAARTRLRQLAAKHPDLTTVISYAFDYRTRMLPFLFVDKRMAPGGVRELGGALLEAGFARTRVVYQQWNRNFQPSAMRLGGRTPDLYLISSMEIHGAQQDRLIREARKIPTSRRPLIIAGGPRTNYEPWLVFGGDPRDPWGADLATTGELYVFLELLAVLLEERASGEPLRHTFYRVRDAGGLDGIPGLVYGRGPEPGVTEELVDTGIQRLLQDYDELPPTALGYRVLERPHHKATLYDRPLAPHLVRRYAPISPLTMTQGCKFRCPYCPIPAYNQHQDRGKSPERIVHDFQSLHETYRIPLFFGTDDNFFNRKDRAVAIVDALADARMKDGTPLGKRCRWGTEVTVHDTLMMKEHLRRCRAAGMRALWLGVEDLTATFVKKGQDEDKTREAFQALVRAGIHPMPMMMHDDTQPLVTWKGARGLLNQAQLLRNEGALTFQALVVNPAAGTKLYKETYQSGHAIAAANGKPVEPYMYDGNHVTASHRKRPWLQQLDVLIVYAFFYNPLRFMKALVSSKSRRGYLFDAAAQLFGMAGLLWNMLKAPRWMWHLFQGPIERTTEEPRSPIPMRSVTGRSAAHDLPPGPDPKKIRRIETRPAAGAHSPEHGARAALRS